MDTQPIKSTFIIRSVVLLLTVFTTIVAWAQSPTTVSTEKQLTDAIADGATNIQLSGDIQLGKYLDIDGKTVTIDLNGHKLYRNHRITGTRITGTEFLIHHSYGSLSNLCKYLIINAN